MCFSSSGKANVVPVATRCMATEEKSSQKQLVNSTLNSSMAFLPLRHASSVLWPCRSRQGPRHGRSSDKELMSVRCGPSLAVLLPDATGFAGWTHYERFDLEGVFFASSRGAHALAGLQPLSAPLPGDHKRRVAALREQGRVEPAAQLTDVKCAQHSPEKAKSILTHIYQVTTPSGMCALFAGLKKLSQGWPIQEHSSPGPAHLSRSVQLQRMEHVRCRHILWKHYLGRSSISSGFLHPCGRHMHNC